MVVVVGVVVVVVVVVGAHAGSAGFVQEQNVSPLILHWSRTNFLQTLKPEPDKPAHAAAISSAHCFEPQSDGAAFAPETKTPAASATVANRTAAPRAILIIVEPPLGLPQLRPLRRSGAGARSQNPVPQATSAVRGSQARTPPPQDPPRRRR